MLDIFKSAYIIQITVSARTFKLATAGVGHSYVQAEL